MGRMNMNLVLNAPILARNWEQLHEKNHSGSMNWKQKATVLRWNTLKKANWLNQHMWRNWLPSKQRRKRRSMKQKSLNA